MKAITFVLTLVALCALITAAPANAGCCDGPGGHAGVCNDPGYQVCADVGSPIVILCEGDEYADTFTAYTNTGGEGCVFGDINGTAFCCDDTDFGATMRKIRIIAGNGDDDIQLYYGLSNWEEDSDLYGNNGSDVIRGSDDSGYTDTIQGGNHVDYLYGLDGDDYLYGGDGDDIMQGNEGADFVRGDAGDDTMDGNDGNDSLYGNDGADTMNGGADNDMLCARDGFVNDTLSGDGGTNNCYCDGAGEYDNVTCNSVTAACP